jgi:hypothetical protein
MKKKVSSARAKPLKPEQEKTPKQKAAAARIAATVLRPHSGWIQKDAEFVHRIKNSCNNQ